MQQYNPSDDSAQVLDTLLAANAYPDIRTALDDAVLNYLAKKIPMDATIDLLAADNGALRFQDQWIDFINEQGRPMISAPIIYEAGKSDSDDLLVGLKADFDEKGVITSTRIVYSPDDLRAKIIHNYGSTVVNPTVIEGVVIPFYNGTTLAEVLQSDDGVKYLQNLFTTTDDSNTIAKTLEHLSNRAAKDITVWTPPSQTTRERNLNRAVWFVDGSDAFLIDSARSRGYGRSRGVLLSPRNRQE